jgi:hypothetical protein
MDNNDAFLLETKLSGALIENYGVMEVDFSAKFPTWILAYCVDTNSWFCTNERFFYYEYPAEFSSEDEGVKYFKDHVTEFFKLSREMYPGKIGSIYLENSIGEYYEFKEIENGTTTRTQDDELRK